MASVQFILMPREPRKMSGTESTELKKDLRELLKKHNIKDGVVHIEFN